VPESTLLAIKRLGRRAGLELLRFNEVNAFDAQRATLMRAQHIDLVLDVGANAGQYVRGLREGGWYGPVVSFEPLAEPFAALSRAAERDPAWTCWQFALSDAPAETEMHVAGNSWSSSLLEMEECHARSAPGSAFVGIERVAVERLDALTGVPAGDRILLKLDVQGGELAALRGAEAILPRVTLVECELSLQPLYVGAPLYREMLDELGGRGFELVGVDPTFAEPGSGRLLQMDALFARAGKGSGEGEGSAAARESAAPPADG
jgi:FkbM family methyltransferase